METNDRSMVRMFGCTARAKRGFKLGAYSKRKGLERDATTYAECAQHVRCQQPS